MLGAGYVIKDFKGFKKKKKKRRAKTDQEEEDNQNKSGSPQPRLNQGPGSQGVTGSNDLRFNLTFSIRDDLSQIYDLLTGINGQADRGSRATSFNPTIEYDVNKNLSLRFYFDYTRVVPKTTISFPITTIRSGLTFRFNIN